MIITLESNEIELEGPSDETKSQSTNQSIKIKACIGSKETKHQSALTHHLKEAYEEQPVSDAESSNIDKKEKEEQKILRLDDDDSEAKSRKQDESSSNQGLKNMRSSDLFGMLVSRRIRKQEN